MKPSKAHGNPCPLVGATKLANPPQGRDNKDSHETLLARARLSYLRNKSSFNQFNLESERSGPMGRPQSMETLERSARGLS